MNNNVGYLALRELARKYPDDQLEDLINDRESMLAKLNAKLGLLQRDIRTTNIQLEAWKDERFTRRN